MNHNFFSIINDRIKTYHPIQSNKHQLIFDYEQLLIVKSNGILNSIVKQDFIDENVIKRLYDEYGKDDVDITLAQIGKLMDKEIIYKKEYKNEYQNKTLDFIHAELSFPTVHSCNLRCSYCFASSGDNYCQEENNIVFSEHLMKRTLDFFVSDFAPDSRYYRVDFVGGGEPLLNFDIIESTYNYAKELSNKIGKPINIWTCTNGTVFNEHILDKISSMSLSMGVSIDGDKDTHDAARKYTDNKGTYEDIMMGVRRIREGEKYSKKLQDIWVLSVVHALNLNVLQILKHHMNHGFTTVQMKPVRLLKSHDLSINYGNYDELINQYQILKEYLIEGIHSGDMSALKLILNENDYLGRIIIYLIMKQKSIYRCGAGKYKLSVSANGDIYPCDSFVGNCEFLLGNILNQTLDHRKITAFKEAHVFNREPCRNCWNKFLCGGDCYYNSVLATGSIQRVDPIICQLKQKLSEIAIEIVYEISLEQNALKHLSRFVARRRNFKMQGARNVTNTN